MKKSGFARSIATAALLGALAAPLHAAPSAAELAALPLDTLLDLQVSGASKFAQRSSDTAASVTVITADEIRAHGWRTLADALRSVRGLMVTSDRIYNYLGVRGFFSAGDYNTRVLLLIDGNRVNDALYDQAYIGDEFPLDLTLVERIEFIPGQGSAVYGANALFGVINVITHAPGERALIAHARVGSAGRRGLQLAGTTPLAGGALSVSASRQLARGEDVADPLQGVARGTDGERRSALALRYDRDGLVASLVHGDRLKLVPLFPGLIFGDPRTRYRDTQTLANIELKRALAADVELTTRAFAGHYNFVGDYAVDYPPPTVNRDVSHGDWFGVEARVFSTAWRDHKLVAGVELQRLSELEQANFDVDAPDAPYLDDRRTASRAALFVEDQIRLAPAVGTTLGLRVDRSGRSTQASPRAALNLRPMDDLVAKAIFGAAFRPPNAFESYYEVDGPGGYRRNPALMPERVRGTELALEWSPDADTRVAASGFDNRASQLIVLDYDADADLYEFRNLGAVRSRGIELELEHHWSGGARVRANLTLQRTKSEGDAVQTRHFPRRMAKLAAIWPVSGRWSLGGELQALSRRADLPGHAIVNATLSTPLPRQGFGFSVGVRNLFGRSLVDPGFDIERLPLVPLSGREWLLTLEAAF